MNTIFDSPLRDIWDISKNLSNGLDWEVIPCTDTRRASFICRKCGGSYENFIDLELDREVRGEDQFLCRHIKQRAVARRLTRIERLALEYGLLKDVHPELEPFYSDMNNVGWNLVPAYPNHNSYWKCRSCGKVRKMSLEDVLSGRHPCKCTRMRNIPFSKPERTIYYEILKMLPSAVRNDRTALCGLELDIYDPVSKVGIEYDGYAFHGLRKLDNDNRKYETCKEHGITLIRVVEVPDGNEHIEHGCADVVIISRPIINDTPRESFVNTVNSVLEAIGVSHRATLEDVANSFSRAKRDMDDFRTTTKASDNNEWLREWFVGRIDGIKCDFGELLVLGDTLYRWRCPDCGREVISTVLSRMRYGCPGRCHGEPGCKYAIFQYDAFGKFERMWDTGADCALFFNVCASYPGQVCNGDRKSCSGHMLRYASEVEWRKSNIEPLSYDLNSNMTCTMSEKYGYLVPMLDPDNNGGFDPYVDHVTCDTKLWWKVDGRSFRQSITGRRLGLFPKKYHSIFEDEDMMIYWDKDANVGVDPQDVPLCSKIEVHWKCPDCGEKWSVSPERMQRRKHKCVCCLNRSIHSQHVNRLKRIADERLTRRMNKLAERKHAELKVADALRDCATLRDVRNRVPECKIVGMKRVREIVKDVGFGKKRDFKKHVVDCSNRRRPVVQLTLDWKFVRRFTGTREAVAEFGSAILHALTCRSEKSRGYRWVYEDEMIYFF